MTNILDFLGLNSTDKISDNDTEPQSKCESKQDVDVVIQPRVHPYFIGASTVGYSHIKMNMPCQDAFTYAELSDDCGIIAVADGLGSASKSEIGARTVVSEAVRAARAALLDESNEELHISDIAEASIRYARTQLILKAYDENYKLRDLACTAIVVVFCKNSVCSAHIGDGAVVIKKGDTLSLLSEPAESEYLNEVVPITNKDWRASVRCSEEFTDVDCIAVFTDGCQRAALLKTNDSISPYEKFFNPLFSYAQNIKDTEEGERKIKALLESQKMCEHSDDDKTLVFSVLKRVKSNNDTHCL